jgi:hypothetical protein
MITLTVFLFTAAVAGWVCFFIQRRKARELYKFGQLATSVATRAFELAQNSQRNERRIFLVLVVCYLATVFFAWKWLKNRQ